MDDAGVLVAADKNDGRAWAYHVARLEVGLIPIVPSPVVAQVSRSPQQVRPRRLLAGCAVVPVGEREAHYSGRLLAKTRTNDAIDALVVTLALDNNATILTSDPEDIARLVQASGRAVAIVAI